MPEQEFLPPRPSGRSYVPDRDEEDPPWAGLPPARPARSRPPAGGGTPPRHGRHAGPGNHGGAGGPADHRRGAPGRASDPRPAAGSGQDGAVPSWPSRDGADPDGEDAPRSRRRRPRGPRRPSGPRGAGERALRAATRRRRRWLIAAGGLVVVAGAAVGVVLVLALAGGPGPAPVTPGALITTFQPGELRQVPDACQAVPDAMVRQYLPGKPQVASPLPVNGSAESACNWTIDKPPVYRLMELNLLAYAPNGLASGDGSATFAAIDGYDAALRGVQDPPRSSADPRATVRTLSGLGDEAFSAWQVFRVGGAVTDVATVVVRYHNVVVTVRLNGLERSNHGSYGPVSESQLAAAAQAFAQAAAAVLR